MSQTPNFCPPAPPEVCKTAPDEAKCPSFHRCSEAPKGPCKAG